MIGIDEVSWLLFKNDIYSSEYLKEKMYIIFLFTVLYQWYKLQIKALSLLNWNIFIMEWIFRELAVLMMGANQDLFLNQVSIQIYEIHLFKYFSKIFRSIFYVFCWFIKIFSYKDGDRQLCSL